MSRSLAAPAPPRANDPNTTALTGLGSTLRASAPRFFEHGLSRTAERTHSTSGNVILHQREEGRRRRLPALDEPKRHELGQHAGRLRRAHVGQTCDSPQVELSSGLGQDRKDAALNTRDYRFDGRPLPTGVA